MEIENHIRENADTPVAKNTLTYAREGIYEIRTVNESKELRLVWWEFLLRVNGGSPERYLNKNRARARSLRLAKNVISHAHNLIGDDWAPWISLTNLRVQDFSKELVEFLQEKEIDKSIAYEIIEDAPLSEKSIAAITEMVRMGYDRIVIDDLPLYETPGNNSKKNLDTLDGKWIQPFAVKLDGKWIREVLSESLDYEKIVRTVEYIRARFWAHTKVIAEWVVPNDLDKLPPIDKLLVQWRDLDVVFNKK